MKTKIHVFVVALLSLNLIGCSSQIYFSQEGATQKDFKKSCLLAESNIRERRRVKYNTTFNYWADNPQIQEASIQGSLNRALAYGIATGEITKPFDENEIKEFVSNMQNDRWEYYPKKPQDRPVFSKNPKLEK